MRDDNSSYKNIKDGKRNLDGIINVYKEAGFTSHDVVAIVRQTIGQKKVGHTGEHVAKGLWDYLRGKENWKEELRRRFHV